MKNKEINKMSKSEGEKKLKELKLEMIKAKSSKTGSSKSKEIRKIIARILTLKNKNGNMSKVWLA